MRLSALSAALFAGLLLAQPVSAKECLKGYYEGTNAPFLSGFELDSAKEHAVLNWVINVTGQLGLAFTDWESASDRSFNCRKQGIRYRCTARAQPCTQG